MYLNAFSELTYVYSGLVDSETKAVTTVRRVSLIVETTVTLSLI
jgi:hypothetical protein